MIRLPSPAAFPTSTLRLLTSSVLLLALLSSGCATESVAPRTVNYEDFGAMGDGITDDLPAIVAAHAFANEKNLPVRTKPDATYHLGTRAITAVIQTDTDWNTSRFIVDDSQGVEDPKRPFFEVRSRFEPVPLRIERLSVGQDKLDLRPEQDLLVYVEDSGSLRFIRRGANRNSGTAQREVFILRRDGSIEGAIEWDYEKITTIEARPIDPQTLVVRGGVFTHIPNRVRQEQGSNYWSRHISIRRSNTEINGLTLKITDDEHYGQPYSGFLNASRAANVTYRNCKVDGRRVFNTIGRAGVSVAMGTYSLSANSVINFSIVNTRMDDIHDRSRWGVAASNFMKNVLVEDSVLSRMDVHQGVSGHYIIRRTTLGHAGLNAVGKGLLLVEDSEIHSGSLISFRSDYGSPWDGDVVVRNSRWILPRFVRNAPVVFRSSNDGMHNFGYPCSMPRTIRIEGLFIDDSAIADQPDQNITFLGDPIGKAEGERPFPFRLTERMLLSGVRTASGRSVGISTNPVVEKAVAVERR